MVIQDRGSEIHKIGRTCQNKDQNLTVSLQAPQQTGKQVCLSSQKYNLTKTKIHGIQGKRGILK